jgi:hypothetical protein
MNAVVAHVMNPKSYLVLLCCTLLPNILLHAQVPSLLSFQGRVMGTNTNFGGVGQFKFALVNSNGSRTLWSHDGTSVSGSEPTGSVPVPVTGGLFSVLLGDTNVTGMTTPLPAAVFTNQDVALRVWFSDGASPAQMLSPDQRITAVGYALMSENIRDGAVTSAKIASNAVNGTHIGANSIGASHLVNGAVGSNQLAANAVLAGNIATGAVSAVQLAPRSVGITALATGAVTSVAISNGAVGTAAISNLAVTTAKIADQAVTSPKLALSAVQGSNIAALAVNNTHIAAGAVGSNHIAPGAISAIHLATPLPRSGTVSSELLGVDFTVTNALFTVTLSPPFATPPNVTLTLQTPSVEVARQSLVYVKSNSVGGFSGEWRGVTPRVTVEPSAAGTYNRMVVVNGNPALAYYAVNNEIRYVRALDTNGVSWGTPIKVDAVGSTMTGLGMAIVNGNPAIVCGAGNATSNFIHFIRANDPDGATWGAPVMITNLYAAVFDFAVVNGRPAVGYSDNIFGGLRYIRANDATGASWGAPVILDMVDASGASLAIISGNPALAYRHAFDSNDLKYVRASNVDGTAWGTPVNVRTTGLVGQYCSMASVNGRPAIAYYNATSNRLEYVRAADATGASWGDPGVLVSTSAGGLYNSLVVINGRPAISTSMGGIRYFLANDPDGTSWTGTSPLDGVTSGVTYTSLISIGNKPALSYYDQASANLRYIGLSPFTINWIALP